MTYTRRGEKLIRNSDAITSEFTSEFAAELGTKRSGQLVGLLAELDVSINGSDAPVRVVSA